MGENVGTLFILNEIGISVRMVYNISNFVIERKRIQYMKSYRNAMKVIRQRSILPRRWHSCWDPGWEIMRMISAW